MVSDMKVCLKQRCIIEFFYTEKTVPIVKTFVHLWKPNSECEYRQSVSAGMTNLYVMIFSYSLFEKIYIASGGDNLERNSVLFLKICSIQCCCCASCSCHSFCENNAETSLLKHFLLHENKI